MTTRHWARARRGAAALVATILVLLAAACGGEDDSEAKEGKSQSRGGGDKGGSTDSTPSARSSPKQSQSRGRGSSDKGGGEGSADVDTSKTLGTMKNSEGVKIVIHSVERDNGGFLTVNGTLKNGSDDGFRAPSEWQGDENDVKRTGPSLAGMTLVDSKDKKRYYVLRDTDDQPLTTTDLPRIDEGDSSPIFAQFPAPPDSTDQVRVQLPQMSATSVEIS